MLEIVNVKILDMDTGIAEQVVKNHDGTYTVFINARYATEAQKQAYRHAVGHIEDGDFEKDSVQEIEQEAHRRHPVCGCRRRQTEK